MNGSYQGIDLVKDLNDGLFVELKQPAPVVDLYRRDLQRIYVSLLLSQLGSDDSGETQGAIRPGISDLVRDSIRPWAGRATLRPSGT